MAVSRTNRRDLMKAVLSAGLAVPARALAQAVTPGADDIVIERAATGECAQGTNVRFGYSAPG